MNKDSDRGPNKADADHLGETETKVAPQGSNLEGLSCVRFYHPPCCSSPWVEPDGDRTAQGEPGDRRGVPDRRRVGRRVQGERRNPQIPMLAGLNPRQGDPLGPKIAQGRARE